MKFHSTPIADLWLIEQSPIVDARGYFTRTYCRRTFLEKGLVADYPQTNHSMSIKAGTIRGLHYQLAPHAETKLIRCVQGAIFDVVVDMRADSPTFLRWHGEELTADNYRMMYIPAGFAHGFQTLVPNTHVTYQSSAEYHGPSERRVRFDDPRVAIEWRIMPPVVSEKDSSGPFIAADFKGESPQAIKS